MCLRTAVCRGVGSGRARMHTFLRQGMYRLEDSNFVVTGANKRKEKL